MSLALGINNITNLYFGTTGATTAYLGNDLVWSKVQPGINYIFRDIDSSGKLTLATGTLENASKLTTISDYGLYYAFYNCTGLTGGVSFPELTTISDYGLWYAFKGCTGLDGSVNFPELTTIGNAGLNNTFSGCTSLTGSISFPKLTTIGSTGLYHVFYNCTGITEVHFKSSLSSNSQCKASNMGCTNATVYFDL